jgi:agmatine/peptidylarginine deiminase
MEIGQFFLPAEWYEQSGVQLTWPHADTDWRQMLTEVQECFLKIAKHIAEREMLLIVAPYIEEPRHQLTMSGVNMQNVKFAECLTNDTWARDHAAITLISEEGSQLLDFTFNGWGLKFPADLDNLIAHRIFEMKMFQAQYINRHGFVLEGGSIESDGLGTLLTTEDCLLSPNRNGEMDKKEIENYLCSVFHLKRVLWLKHGYLEGDDTDGHIDTLARFCPNNTITYVQCNDKKDEHYNELHLMEQELQSFRTLEGQHYRLLPLPLPSPIYMEGLRLPATYANFLIINGVILYPTYNQPNNDQEAKEVLQQAFPNYEIIGINCRVLIKQHGSLHCVTMQYPKNVLV